MTGHLQAVCLYTGISSGLTMLDIRVWDYLYLYLNTFTFNCKGKGKVLRYWLPRVGPGADPGVQAVSLQVTKSSFSSRLPLLSARPVVSFPAEECHSPFTSTKLCCLVTEAHRCEQLAQGCYSVLPPVRIKPTT